VTFTVRILCFLRKGFVKLTNSGLILGRAITGLQAFV
jgi:hypothetical protein